MALDRGNGHKMVRDQRMLIKIVRNMLHIIHADKRIQLPLLHPFNFYRLRENIDRQPHIGRDGFKARRQHGHKHKFEVIHRANIKVCASRSGSKWLGPRVAVSSLLSAFSITGIIIAA